MIKNRQTITILIIISIFFMLTTGISLAENRKIKIKHKTQELFVFKTDGITSKAISGGLSLEIKKKENQTYFHLGSERLKLKQKGNKHRLFYEDGLLCFSVKITPEKIKISLVEDDPFPWSLKKKNDGLQFKVRKGDKKIGKIKFYPDKNKIKAKDAGENELCSVKSDRISAVPVVCFLEGLSDKEKLLIFSLLSYLGI